MNQSLLERRRSMLYGPSFSKEFWAKILKTCYLINMSPSIALKLKTPMEKWMGHILDYIRFRVLCYVFCAHIRQDKCVFLNYPEGVKGYQLWCVEPEKEKYIISRDVMFGERKFHLFTKCWILKNLKPKIINLRFM